MTLPPPQHLTPMGWRILEALGDPVGTGNLPVAFAHADLRGTSGWRAQIDAAERLTRMGVMQPERLTGIYSQRRAAASGGVWDRVRAVQAGQRLAGPGMRTAVAAVTRRVAPVPGDGTGKPPSPASSPTGWPSDLTGPSARMQWTILLLAETRLDLAATIAPRPVPRPELALALASGTDLPDSDVCRLWRGIQAAFGHPHAANAAKPVADRGEGGVGCCWTALGQIADATEGDMLAAERGLAALLGLGLDRDARQIALELLLLERRG